MKNLVDLILESNKNYKEISEKEARELHKKYNKEICLLSSDYDINNKIHRRDMSFISKNDDFDEKLNRFKRYQCYNDIYPKFYIQ